MRRTKKFWNAQINIVLEYCQNKNWKVKFKKMGPDFCYTVSKEIEIGLSQTPENMLYSLLHEVGHLVESQNPVWYKKRYPGLTYRKNSKVFKAFYVLSEFSAWNVGLKIAKKLGVYVNEKNFLKTQSLCIFSYFYDAVDSGKSQMEDIDDPV